MSLCNNFELEKLLDKFASLLQNIQILTHFRPMFHLWINQVIGFYKQNVTLPLVLFKHFGSKSQLPGFYVSGTLVENGLRKLAKIRARAHSKTFEH